VIKTREAAKEILPEEFSNILEKTGENEHSMTFCKT